VRQESRKGHKWFQQSEFRDRFLWRPAQPDSTRPLKSPFYLPSSLSPHRAQINRRSYALALKLSRVSLPAAEVGEPETSQSPLCVVVSVSTEIASDRIDILAEVRCETVEMPLIEQLTSNKIWISVHFNFASIISAQ